MIRKITYITYQTFPSEKANTIQTMENLKYLNRQWSFMDFLFPRHNFWLYDIMLLTF